MSASSVLHYAHGADRGPMGHVLRAVTLTIMALALIDVSVKLYTRGATIDMQCAYGLPPRAPLQARDAIATVYHQGTVANVVKDLRRGLLAGLIVTTLTSAIVAHRQPLASKAFLIFLFAWLSLGASYFVQCSVGC